MVLSSQPQTGSLSGDTNLDGRVDCQGVINVRNAMGKRNSEVGYLIEDSKTHMMIFSD